MLIVLSLLLRHLILWMTVKGQYHEQDVYICLNNKHVKVNMQKLTVSSIVAELLDVP